MWLSDVIKRSAILLSDETRVIDSQKIIVEIFYIKCVFVVPNVCLYMFKLYVRFFS